MCQVPSKEFEYFYLHLGLVSLITEHALGHLIVSTSLQA